MSGALQVSPEPCGSYRVTEWDRGKPDQEQGNPQSVEMRMLMAVLRAFAEAEPAS